LRTNKEETGSIYNSHCCGCHEGGYWSSPFTR
jgi:hypothetical protein